MPWDTSGLGEYLSSKVNEGNPSWDSSSPRYLRRVLDRRNPFDPAVIRDIVLRTIGIPGHWNTPDLGNLGLWGFIWNLRTGSDPHINPGGGVLSTPPGGEERTGHGPIWDPSVQIMSDTGGGGGGGGGAPTDAEYIVSTGHTSLTAERVATDTSTVTWDFSTSGQAKANVPDDAITYAKIQNVTDARVLGRAAGSTGDPQELTVTAPLTIGSGALGFTTGALDNIARTTVRINGGTDTGSRRRLNFIAGTGISLSAVDDSGSEEVDITITATGGGGGGLDHAAVMSRVSLGF